MEFRRYDARGDIVSGIMEDCGNGGFPVDDCGIIFRCVESYGICLISVDSIEHEFEFHRRLAFETHHLPKVNKSGLKVYIIQNIDRKVSLDDIANAKNLEMPKLLDEIEAIVNSGTKLNLDYYINEILDEDHQDEVFDYFREAETESISDALDELGEDEYSEEDIRLMRIKFMAELGH